MGAIEGVLDGEVVEGVWEGLADGFEVVGVVDGTGVVGLTLGLAVVGDPVGLHVVGVFVIKHIDVAPASPVILFTHWLRTLFLMHALSALHFLSHLNPQKVPHRHP